MGNTLELKVYYSSLGQKREKKNVSTNNTEL